MLRVWQTTSSAGPYEALTVWQGIKSKVMVVSFFKLNSVGEFYAWRFLHIFNAQNVSKVRCLGGGGGGIFPRALQRWFIISNPTALNVLLGFANSWPVFISTPEWRGTL